jgi:hypothetical protein
VSVSIRPLLVPGVALAAVGAVALGPSVVVPSAMTPARPAVEAPVVQMMEVQLAGFAQDLYYALEGWVEFGAQVLQDFFFWNPEFAAQIGNLYTTLQPIVERVVILVINLIEGPADILGTLTGLASGIFGLPVLSAASVPAALAAARTGDGPRAAAATLPDDPDAAPAELAPTELAPAEAAPAGAAPTDAAPTEAAPTEAAPTGAAPTEAATQVPPAEAASEVVAEVAPVEVSVPAAVSRAERGRAARSARQAAPAAAATEAAAPVQDVDEASVATSQAEAPGISRASRGAPVKAAGQTRSTAKAAR